MINNKVLIVDNEEEYLAFLDHFLRRTYSNVYTSSSGKKALEIFFQEKPDFVLLDIKIPDLDGFSILKKMREVDSETKIVVITCKDDKDSVEKAKKLGANDYIEKPFELAALNSTISSFS